jgi:hypothetical protein
MLGNLGLCCLNLPLNVCLVISNKYPKLVIDGVNCENGFVRVLVVNQIDVSASIIVLISFLVLSLSFGDDAIVNRVDKFLLSF